jgi:rhamnose transport system substrate-binding protein
MSRSSRRVLAATASSVLLLAVAACGGTTKENSSDTGAAAQTGASADPNAQLKTGLKIAYLPKQLNNPYSDVETGGGKVAVGELKGEYKLVGPNDASASSQVSYINRPRSRSWRSTRTPTSRAATRSSTRPPPRASARAW